ncbi:MAG TPA: hypothetical protein VF648_00540 [Pyrinomonadaceae bacterium]|jgi:hypothetical protein
MQVLTREQIYERIKRLPPEEQAAVASAVLERYGEALQTEKFKPYQFDPEKYIQDFLGWQPWSGTNDKPGQIQIMDAYTLALRQQFERRDFEHGRIAEADLVYWKPNQTIKNYIRVEAGHTTGKTKTESGLVNHFLDCFAPSTVLMYGPSQDSLKDNLWQELQVDRGSNEDLPGRMLDSMEIRIGPNHFAKCRVTSNAHGKGTTRIQGKHGEYLMFVLDEAEGIPDFVFEAIDSMTSGGISVVLMVANPQTRTSKFHKMKEVANVRSFRMSCLHHPNVRQGKEVVPGAVRRHYVEMMVDKHCAIVEKHNEDDHTFELEFPVTAKKRECPAGTVFLPNAEFLFRVLGKAPKNISDKTAIPVGRFESACERVPQPDEDDKTWARLGVDVSRFGKDYGTLYVRYAGAVKRAAQFLKQDSNEYFRVVKETCEQLAQNGVKSLHIRVDGGGGFGGGLIDKLNIEIELRELFEDFEVFEVHFQSAPSDQKSYDDLITEMMFEAAETIKGIAILDAPETLEADLCEREYKTVNRKGKDKKKIESKDIFRDRLKRSPDDGDGFCLAVAPDKCFSKAAVSVGEAGRVVAAPTSNPLDALFRKVKQS